MQKLKKSETSSDKPLLAGLGSLEEEDAKAMIEEAEQRGDNDLARILSEYIVIFEKK